MSKRKRHKKARYLEQYDYGQEIVQEPREEPVEIIKIKKGQFCIKPEANGEYSIIAVHRNRQIIITTIYNKNVQKALEIATEKLNILLND